MVPAEQGAERKTAEPAERTDRDAEKQPVHVTRTFLPPRAEYDAWLDEVYASNILTNKGPIHQRLEETLTERFDVPFLRLMANGTLAIQLAIRALGVSGKVITTPFSYVATTSALLWEGCEPIFVDIDPTTCCIDASLIEAAITEDTTAILATHVYGIPCDVEAIEFIAKKHGLKVIYDAAHAFDVKVKGKSVLAWGDASTLSFHATKLFHTVEGGAVITHDASVDEKIRLLRSFGHVGDDHFSLGMNAKMSEMHAAMGMAVLPHVPTCITERRSLHEQYVRLLQGLPIRTLTLRSDITHNYAYFPIFLETSEVREHVQRTLMERNIIPRRYFYPSLNRLPYVANVAMPVSDEVAATALSLPFYPGLPDEVVEVIAATIKELTS